MIDPSESYEAVLDAIATVTRQPRATLGPEMKLATDLHLESIDTIDLLFEIEQRLGLSVNLADAFQSARRDHGQTNQFDLKISELAGYIASLVK